MKFKPLKESEMPRFKVVQEAAKKCKRRGEFQVKHRAHYDWAYSRDILDQICSHMPVNHKELVWTKEKLKKEALKYKRRTAFQKGSPSAYRCAYSNGLLDEVCAHMPKPKSKNWIDRQPKLDEIIELALSYENITDFQHKNSGAYTTLTRFGLYEEVKKLHKEHTGDKSRR